VQQAASSSASVIGLQPVMTATATARPWGRVLSAGVSPWWLLLATISTGPRYFVAQILVSTVFWPLATKVAHGCLRQIDFKPLLINRDGEEGCPST